MKRIFDIWLSDKSNWLNLKSLDWKDRWDKTDNEKLQQRRKNVLSAMEDLESFPCHGAAHRWPHMEETDGGSHKVGLNRKDGGKAIHREFTPCSKNITSSPSSKKLDLKSSVGPFFNKSIKYSVVRIKNANSDAVKIWLSFIALLKLTCLQWGWKNIRFISFMEENENHSHREWALWHWREQLVWWNWIIESCSVIQLILGD